MVFDHLQDDRKALHACSLTCCDWNVATRRHIFSSLVIRTELQFMFLETTFTQYAHVKSLTISPLEMSDIFSLKCWLRFDHLTELTLKWFDSYHEDPIQPFINNFSSVETLAIINCTFNSLHTIMWIIHSLRSLHTIRLLGVDWRENRTSLDHPFPITSFPLRLFCLKELGLDVTDLLNYLLDLHPRWDLSSFQVGYDIFPRVLSSCQHSLEILDLRFRGEFHA